MTDAIKVLDSMIMALSYERSDEEMIALYDELIKRFSRDMNVSWTDDGNIIYSTIVILFGDYGTSPRSGWFTNNIISDDLSKHLEWRKTHENYV